MLTVARDVVPQVGSAITTESLGGFFRLYILARLRHKLHGRGVRHGMGIVSGGLFTIKFTITL